MKIQTNRRLSRYSIPNQSATLVAIGSIGCYWLLIISCCSLAYQVKSADKCFFYSGDDILTCNIAKTNVSDRLEPTLALTCADRKINDTLPCNELLGVKYKFCSLILILNRLSPMRGLLNQTLISPGDFAKCIRHIDDDPKFSLDVHLLDAKFFIYGTDKQVLFSDFGPEEYLKYAVGQTFKIESSAMDSTSEANPISSRHLSDMINVFEATLFKTLELIDMRGDVIENLSFRSEGGTFKMRDSTFKGLVANSVLGWKLRSFEMERVTLDRLDKGSILILDLPCDGQARIKISDTLDINKMDTQPIFFKQHNHCKYPIHKPWMLPAKPLDLEIDLRKNKFWPFVPKDLLAPLLDEHLNNNSILNLNVKLDKLECCHLQNKWFFQMYWNNRTAFTEAITAPCSDIFGNMSIYKEESDLKSICSDRNLFPVHMIFILGAVVLAAGSVIVGVLVRVYCRARHPEPAPVPGSIVSDETKSSIPEIHSSGPAPSTSNPSQAIMPVSKVIGQPTTSVVATRRSRSSSRSKKRPGRSISKKYVTATSRSSQRRSKSNSKRPPATRAPIL